MATPLPLCRQPTGPCSSIMTDEAKPPAWPGSSQLMNQGLRIMQIVSKSLFRKAGLCALLLASQLAVAVAIEPLEYTPQHQKTTTEVVSQLVQKHYREQALNDELSAQYLNNYLRNLDPAKSYFFHSDVDAFETHKARFDDYLAKGDLKVPFEIFNTYRQRLTTRLEAVIAELESDDLSLISIRMKF